jgi:glutathione synthase/RimK-type ligase-like ATP-grasp enzyme
MANTIRLEPAWDLAASPRLGVAHLTRLAFKGADLFALWNELMARVTDDAAGAGIGMDLSVIAQLRGDKALGLAIQQDALKLHQVFRHDCGGGTAPLRILALAAAAEIGANTPIDFLLKGADANLAVLYVGPGVPPPTAVPDHDIAIVIAPAAATDALDAIEEMTRHWPVPVLNRPSRIRVLERDSLYRNLKDVQGLEIPPTLRITRAQLEAGGAIAFPFIARPLASHAGFGLARLENQDGADAYLAARTEDVFFVSPYIDYASADGRFRKYRIALIDGRPMPVHMAIAEEWKVWYLNADMALSAANRAEEAAFMQGFEAGFAARHAAALTGMGHRLGLDYVLMDCAETREGKLLVFEADHCAIVHDMDPINVYPYKPAHMQALFDRFAAMLARRVPKKSSVAA